MLEYPLPHTYTHWYRVQEPEWSYTTITAMYNTVIVLHICREKKTTIPCSVGQVGIIPWQVYTMMIPPALPQRGINKHNILYLDGCTVRKGEYLDISRALEHRRSEMSS